MSNILTHTEQLDNIVQIMHDEAGGAYDSLFLRLTHNREEGWSEVYYHVVQGEVAESKYLSTQANGAVVQLGSELHEAMLPQTGKGWEGFTIDVPAGGQAKVKFNYPESL